MVVGWSVGRGRLVGRSVVAGGLVGWVVGGGWLHARRVTSRTVAAVSLCWEGMKKCCFTNIVNYILELVVIETIYPAMPTVIPIIG